MSEQQTPTIYKDHYELQQHASILQQSLNNIHAALVGFVAPHGVQLSLQEVIDLTIQKLQGQSEQILSQDEQVASEAHAASSDSASVGEAKE